MFITFSDLELSATWGTYQHCFLYVDECNKEIETLLTQHYNSSGFIRVMLFIRNWDESYNFISVRLTVMNYFVSFGSLQPFKIFHPSIFYTCLIRRSGRGGAGAYPSSHRARGDQRAKHWESCVESMPKYAFYGCFLLMCQIFHLQLLD